MSEGGVVGRPGKRLTILLGARDHVGGHGLVSELLERARRAGVAGATVFRAHEGFGSSGRLHRTHVLSEDAPMAVVIVDRPERIDAYLADIYDLVTDALVTVDDVEIVDV
jgi:uncharacterized protein